MADRLVLWSMISQMCAFVPGAHPIYGGGGAARSVPIYFSDLVCTGSEESLVQCPGSGPGTFCLHSEDAHVACQGIYIQHACTCMCVCMLGDSIEMLKLKCYNKRLPGFQ